MTAEEYHVKRGAILRRIDDAPNAEAAEALRGELEELDREGITVYPMGLLETGRGPITADPSPEIRDPQGVTAHPFRDRQTFSLKCKRCGREYTTANPRTPLCGVCQTQSDKNAQTK